MSDTLGPGNKLYVPTIVDGSGQSLVDSFGSPITQGYTTKGQVLVDGSGYGLQQGAGYIPVVHDARGVLFYVAEITTYGSGSIDTLRVSDIGYRTRFDDPGGVMVYPSLLDQSFEIDRRVSLELSGNSTATYGAIRITNLNEQFDFFATGRNTDSRSVKIKVGQKSYDPERGIFVDPPYSSLRDFFSGACGSWLVNEDSITIPLKDATYLIDKPIQTRLYAGTGGVEGPESFAGTPKPMTRGGTQDYPVRNVPIKLVDTVYNVWQWTDGPGTVVVVYENSAYVFNYAGDVSDPNQFYTSVTPPGSYRTCNQYGLLQMGSITQGLMTADVTGTCGGLAVSQTVSLAQTILLYDLSLPQEFLNTAQFAYADIAYPYFSGFFLDQETSGLAVITRLLASVGGRLLSSRSGAVGVFVPPRTQTGAVPVVQLNRDNVVSVNRVALPSVIDPPPYRWRVSYNTCYSVQSSGYNPSISEDRKQFVANQYRYALWVDTGVQAAWVKPNDPSPVETYLLRAVHARALAGTLGDQWKTLPDYFEVVVPVVNAVGLDIGSYVELKWPLGILKSGAIAQIYGEQPRSFDNVVTFEVLVNTAFLSEDQFVQSRGSNGVFVLDVSFLDVGVLGGADDVQASDFILDYSQLDVGVLGGTNNSTNNSTNNPITTTPANIGTGNTNTNEFILDVSYLDIGILGAGAVTITPPSITPPSGTIPDQQSGNTNVGNQTGDFVLDVSYLDAGTLAYESAAATPPVTATPPPATTIPAPASTSPPSTAPPPTTVPTAPAYFTLDTSQLDTDILGE